MTNEEYLLEWFKNHVWARPKPSKICDGVGMFAIRDIPKGTKVFDLAEKSVSAWVSWEKAKSIPFRVLEWVLESQPDIGDRVIDYFQGEEPSLVFLHVTKGLNWQTTWYFVNHSNKPNLKYSRLPVSPTYTTLRDIKEDEELLEDYNETSTIYKSQ
jgi:hypothetical protein